MWNDHSKKYFFVVVVVFFVWVHCAVNTWMGIHRTPIEYREWYALFRFWKCYSLFFWSYQKLAMTSVCAFCFFFGFWLPSWFTFSSPSAVIGVLDVVIIKRLQLNAIRQKAPLLTQTIIFGEFPRSFDVIRRGKAIK